MVKWGGNATQFSGVPVGFSAYLFNNGTKTAENANKIILHKTGAMRSLDGSLPVLQYGATNACAEDFH